MQVLCTILSQGSKEILEVEEETSQAGGMGWQQNDSSQPSCYLPELQLLPSMALQRKTTIERP